MNKIYLKNLFLSFSFIISLLSCKSNKYEVDVSKIEADISITRFEKELFNIKGENKQDKIRSVQQKHPEFYNLLVQDIFGLKNTTDSFNIILMDSFTSNAAMQNYYDSVIAKYPHITDIEEELEEAFRHIKYYYPRYQIPKPYTFISEFSVGTINKDGLLGIGLDFYLGENYPYPPYLEFPKYMVRKMKKEYILPNSVKEIAMTMYPPRYKDQKLIDRMIYNGKILHFLDRMLPETEDSLKIGYLQKQLDWANDNEAEIWTFFLKHELLYSTKDLEFHRYVGEGPTTPGMPAESPGNIGSWVGWQIVRKYMDAHPEVSLPELMRDQDGQKILAGSRYKPKRGL